METALLVSESLLSWSHCVALLRASLNCLSDCCAVSPSVSAREKLAMTGDEIATSGFARLAMTLLAVTACTDVARDDAASMASAY